MYTELILGCRFKADTPKHVIDTLKYLCGQIEEEPENFILKDQRNPIDGAISGYFGVDRPVFSLWESDRQWSISSRCNIKNYGGEIETLLEFIKPHIESGSGDRDFYAITCHETDKAPTVYYLS